MSFSNPSFLWGLFALGIPILVHLFNFRKTVRVYYSNTRLLQQLREETTQKRKLKQLLVLAARLLFLFFLIIAFAQPFVPAGVSGSRAKNKVLYIDNSLSMSAPAADKTRALDGAIQMGQGLLAVFPPDTRFRVLTNDFSPFSNRFRSGPEAADALATLRLSPVNRTAAEVAARIESLSGSEDVFWISDFQKSTWGAVQPAFDSARHWHLVKMPLRQTANVFVDTLFLDRPFAAANETNTLRVKLRNSGNTPVEGMVVKLAVGRRQEATATVNIDAMSAQTVSFDLSDNYPGRGRGTVTFSDFPISFDNTFYFALNQRQPLRMVEIKGPAATARVQAVFANQSLFSLVSFQSANVEYGSLTGADLVVLNEVPRLDPGLAAALAAHQQAEGKLLLIPARQADFNSYHPLFPRHPFTVVKDGRRMEIERPDTRNPFFQRVFEEQSANVLMPAATPLLRAGATAVPLLQFKDQTPFLSQAGNTFLLASSLQDADTDFSRHALFVPVFYRLAATGRRHEGAPYYTTGQSVISLPLETRSQEPVRLAGEQEWVPAQRRENTAVVLELPAFFVQAGFYDVLTGADTVGLLAFNPPAAESVLDSWDADELEKRLAPAHNVAFLQAADAASFGNEIKERYLGRPLWREALLLALAFLLAEVLLIRFLK
jgi:hypothetical protein